MTWNRNRLTETLGIDYPIIQGPLGGLSSQRLTAAVSNFGGLGSFGALSLSPEEIKNAISQIRSLTAKPFAVNLWVSMEDDGARSSDEAAFNRSLAPLASYFSESNAPRPEYKPYSPITFEDQARILLEEKVSVFSFIFGIPPKEILDECRAIGTATTPDEAVALQHAGVDAIVASGAKTFPKPKCTFSTPDTLPWIRLRIKSPHWCEALYRNPLTRYDHDSMESTG